MLGQLLPAGDLEGLSARLDEIMLGHGAPPAKQLTFQLDQGGSYTRSDMGVHQGPTRDYRRIEGLEHEPLVAAFLAHPLIDQIFNRYYGDTVQRRRPVMMNKPAGKSTPLPWHQDVPVGPRCLPTDTPIATIWTAIDAADPDNGCMDMVPGTPSLAPPRALRFPPPSSARIAGRWPLRGGPRCHFSAPRSRSHGASL
jgi:hypothetical protein